MNYTIRKCKQTFDYPSKKAIILINHYFITFKSKSISNTCYLAINTYGKLESWHRSWFK